MFKFLLSATLMAVPTAAFAQMTPTKVYLAKAGASDLFERRSATLMIKSGNPSLRQFATMMIRDHTKSTADVKAAAQKERIAVSPPMLSKVQLADLTALKHAQGKARDQLYIGQQKAAHRDALILQQGYSTQGEAPALRAVAGTIVPVVQHHIEMLDQL